MVPLSALDRYAEGADLRLFCSAHAPQVGGNLAASSSTSGDSSAPLTNAATRLTFEWRRNNNELLAVAESGPLPATTTIEQHPHPLVKSGRLHVSMMDDFASLLRLDRLEADDAGNYTCLARNQFGSDSSTVRVNVNG